MNKKGFTLIELLATITIISIVTTMISINIFKAHVCNTLSVYNWSRLGPMLTSDKNQTIVNAIKISYCIKYGTASKPRSS